MDAKSMWSRLYIHWFPKLGWSISAPMLGGWENRVFSVAFPIHQSCLFIHFKHHIFCWAVWNVLTDFRLIRRNSEYWFLDESDLWIETMNLHALWSLQELYHLTDWVKSLKILSLLDLFEGHSILVSSLWIHRVLLLPAGPMAGEWYEVLCSLCCSRVSADNGH